MRDSVPKVMLPVLLAGLAFAAEPVSKVVGNLRIIPVTTADGLEGAATISKLDGSRTGYYYDLGERAGVLRPAAPTVVLLGLGGGEMLRAARRSLPNATLIGVDNDPRMIQAARAEFRVGDFGVRPVEADAFAHVKKLRNVGVLMVDLFVGDKMPAAMLMPQFWTDCRRAIAKDGLVMVNVYPPSKAPRVTELLGGAGLRELERHTVQGSTVLFAAP